MPASRNYSSTAGLMHLVGGITGPAASLVVDVTTGLPTVPFTLLLDPGLGVEEIVTVTAVGGATLTVTRGVGGTSAQAHTNGAEVRHAYYGQDFQDSRDHEANTTSAHGVTGAVVGTTNTQTLANKTLDSTTVFGALPYRASAATAVTDASGNFAVTFPGGRFTVAPLVYATMLLGGTANGVATIDTGVTTGGCTGRAVWYSAGVWSTAPSSLTVQVFAVQMTPTTAAG